VLKTSAAPIDPTLSSDLLADLGFDSLQIMETVAELEDRSESGCRSMIWPGQGRWHRSWRASRPSSGADSSGHWTRSIRGLHGCTRIKTQRELPEGCSPPSSEANRP
jgi:hypothetical protein